MNFKHPLILASSSPRRQFLMREAGYDFKVEKPDVEESFPKELPVEQVAKYLASKKAEYFRAEIHNEVVITADTVVILDNTILNKPSDRAEAIQMLSMLSGRTHIANLSCGITSQVSGLFLKVFAIGVYQVLHENFNLVTWDKTWLYWVALFLLADHSYYWAHRMSHQINLFWGGHVVHHQSEEYNLSVALRQSSLQVIWTFAFSLPLAFVGFETLDFALMSAYITLYQFWIHTESINKMGWFEYLFNTPSHHRVHHGRNPKYIDKNHAGTLIIWDKMYGTFQEEEERPTYGITKPINSWNAVFANFSHYVEMSKDLKRIPYWSDKFKYLFMKPGWLPEYLGGYRAAPAVDKATYKKYDTPSPVTLNLYVLFQYILCLGGTSMFLFNAAKFTLGEKAIITVLISIVVVNCGVLFENRTWVRYAEWLRIIIYPLLLVAFVYLNALPTWLYGVALAYLIISAFWFSVINKQLRYVQAI